MIKGIGIDICDVKKLKNAMKKERFIKRVFNEEEIKYCKSKKNLYIHFAGRFAVKEAFIKAVSEKKDIPLNEIIIINNKHGKPEIKKTKKIKEVLKLKKSKNIEISISHIDNTAIGVCVLY